MKKAFWRGAVFGLYALCAPLYGFIERIAVLANPKKDQKVFILGDRHISNPVVVEQDALFKNVFAFLNQPNYAVRCKFFYEETEPEGRRDRLTKPLCLGDYSDFKLSYMVSRFWDLNGFNKDLDRLNPYIEKLQQILTNQHGQSLGCVRLFGAASFERQNFDPRDYFVTEKIKRGATGCFLARKSDDGVVRCDFDGTTMELAFCKQQADQLLKSLIAECSVKLHIDEAVFYDYLQSWQQKAEVASCLLGKGVVKTVAELEAMVVDCPSDTTRAKELRLLIDYNKLFAQEIFRADLNLLIELAVSGQAIVFVHTGTAHLEDVKALLQTLFDWQCLADMKSQKVTDWKKLAYVLYEQYSCGVEACCAFFPKERGVKCNYCDAKVYCSKKCRLADWAQRHRDECSCEKELNHAAARIQLITELAESEQ